MHGMNLLGCFAGDLRKRYTKVGNFIKQVFAETILPYRAQEIEKRIGDVDKEALQQFLEYLDTCEPGIFSHHKSDRYIDRTTLALKKEDRMGTIKHLLTILEYSRNPDLENHDSTHKVMLSAYYLSTSKNLSSVFATWQQKTHQTTPSSKPSKISPSTTTAFLDYGKRSNHARSNSP